MERFPARTGYHYSSKAAASRESSRPLETAGFVGEQLSRSALLLVARTGHLGLSNLQTPSLP